MGNDLGRMIEQNAFPSMGEEEGMCFVVANLKKKVKPQHIKVVTQKLPTLTALTITSSNLKALPPELANANTKCELKELNLANNVIKQLPKALNAMFESLTTLDLNKNALKAIEENVGLERMISLRRLSLDENKFTEVPAQVFMLTNLVSLHLAKNAIEQLPNDLEHLVKLSQLKLDGNRLTEFPAEALAKLSHLEILDLSNNQLSDMDLPKGKKMQLQLRAVNLGHNSFKEVPKFIHKATSLTELHLDHNRITDIPEKLTKLSQLKLLLLNSNKIPQVPLEMWAEKFTELQTFDLKDNPLEVNVVEVITKFGSLSLLRPALKAKMEEQAIQRKLQQRTNSLSSSASRRRLSTASKLNAPATPNTPAAPAPPPASLLAPPPPRQGAGDVSPRQKFRNNAINRARIVPSVGVPDDSPDYFARLLESTEKEVLGDELVALRDKIMYQPYAWLDAFIAAKGLTNLITLLERNAKQLQHVENDASKLHYEALHCYKILIRVKLKEVLGTTGAIDALAFTLLPNVLPSVRKIAAKLLVDLARIKHVGRKKILVALERVRRHLVEKKGKEEVPSVRKRERFRLLVNLLGKPAEQDSAEVWEERKAAAKESGTGGGVDNKEGGGVDSKEAEDGSSDGAKEKEKEEEDSAEETDSKSASGENPTREEAEEPTSEDEKEQTARRSLRLHAMRLVNMILSVTSNITGRVSIRKSLIDLGILDKIMWVENASSTFVHSEWQAEVDSFEAFMDDDNEDLEFLLQKKPKKPKKGKRKTTPSFPKRSERSSSFGIDSPSGSPVDKLRQVRRLNSISNLNRLAAASKSASDQESLEDSDNDQSDSDDDASSTDPTTGDTAFTENDDTYASDEEGEDNWEEEQVPYEDYLRIKVVTLGTSVQIPMVIGAKGHIIVPFDVSKTIGDVTLKIKSQYPEMEATKFDWGLFILPTEATPDGLWPDEHRHCGYYDLKGQVLAEFRLKPWILKITCNATDVINTLTLTKMRFDPHRTCADAVALVRSRFPHVSAWEEYDWGLYWHKGTGGGAGAGGSMTQRSMSSPDTPMSPLKKSRRRTTISKKEKKKIEEEQQKLKEEQQKLEKEAGAQEKEEGTWLVDTERLAAYSGLYMTDDLLELKMKVMGIKVKILSQEAVDFMQFDPMHKVEDILRDMASRVLPDSEKRNYLNYGLYLQRANPDQESSWLQEDKKFNSYKFGPEDCLCYLVRKKPIMILVYSEKVSAQMTKNEKYATFSRSASRLFNKAQMPIYTHFPVDFMVPVSDVKSTIAAKVSAKGEDYELYYRKTPDEVTLLDEKSSLNAQQVEAYSRLLFVRNGVFASVEELAGAMGDKEEEAKAAAHVSEGHEPEGGEEVADESFKKITFEDEARTEVKAGSLSSLIDHLIETPIYEPEYTKAFLLTHHAFTSSRVVLDYLLKRYLTCSEEIERASKQEEQVKAAASAAVLAGDKKEDKKKDKKKKKDGEGVPTPPPPPEEADGKGKAEKTQRRILYLLKVWVDEYFYDFYDEDQLLERLIEFLNQTMVKEGGASSALVLHQRILQSIEANTMGTGAKGKQLSMDFAPLPRVPRSLDKPNWFIIDEVELARQLTIRSFELFSAIRLFEFFGQPWSKPSTQPLAPNLMAFIEYFNSISRAVSTALLQQRKIRERVKLLTRFIRTAEELRDLGNYHLLQAFIAGFSNSAVARLQWTKARLPKNSATALQELEDLMSMNSSFKSYRIRLSNSNPPAIPYIGVCLQDLTFIEDGNRNKVENLINFSKHKLVYGVISLLEKFQKTGYHLQRVEEIQSFLKEPVQLDEKQLYSLSLKVEPRNAGRSDIQ